jgi:hypothetical protein
MLNETDLRLNFTDVLKSSTAYEALDGSVLRPRLLLGLNGIGANAGFQRMAGFRSGTTAKDLAYVGAAREGGGADREQAAVARIICPPDLPLLQLAPRGAAGRVHTRRNTRRLDHFAAWRIGPIPHYSIIILPTHLHLPPQRSRAPRPTKRWRTPMKAMILAALTVLSLGVGVAAAQGLPGGSISSTDQPWSVNRTHS